LRRRWYVVAAIAFAAAVGWTVDVVEDFGKAYAYLEQLWRLPSRYQAAAFELGMDVAATRHGLRYGTDGTPSEVEALRSSILAALDARQAARSHAICPRLKLSELMRAADPDGQLPLGFSEADELTNCIREERGADVAQAFRIAWLLTSLQIEGSMATDTGIKAEYPALVEHFAKNFTSTAPLANKELEALGAGNRIPGTLTPEAVEAVVAAMRELVRRWGVRRAPPTAS
jgi:hypothetical protein